MRFAHPLLVLAVFALAFAAMDHPASAANVGNLDGVNLSGAELNPGPGKRLNFDYTYPNSSEISYFASKGFGVIRLPFDLTRLYPKPDAELASDQLAQIRTIVADAASHGMRVILDPHNYGSIYDARTGANRLIGADEEGTRLFADFWRRAVTAFRGSPNVIFGLMNEPHGQTALQWRAGANAAVTAIRAGGATQLILIPGTDYTGAHSWTAANGNGAAWSGYHGDPLDNFAFEMHQYLDSNSSGASPVCTPNAGAKQSQGVPRRVRLVDRSELPTRRRECDVRPRSKPVALDRLDLVGRRPMVAIELSIFSGAEERRRRIRRPLARL